MDAVSARSGYQGAKNFKGKGIAEINDPSKKGLMPPGFSKSVAKPTGAAAGYSGNFSKAVVDVKGSALGSGNNKDSSSMKDDFDSFLDEVAGPGIGGGSSGIESAQLSNNVQSAVIPPSRARIGGLFLPYLPQDDAVAAGLGSREGGIDASEAQEVVDHLNQQLAALLRCSPAEFWKKGEFTSGLPGNRYIIIQLCRRHPINRVVVAARWILGACLLQPMAGQDIAARSHYRI